jgi:hypothetical protein
VAKASVSVPPWPRVAWRKATIIRPALPPNAWDTSSGETPASAATPEMVVACQPWRANISPATTATRVRRSSAAARRLLAS